MTKPLHYCYSNERTEINIEIPNYIYLAGLVKEYIDTCTSQIYEDLDFTNNEMHKEFYKAVRDRIINDILDAYREKVLDYESHVRIKQQSN